MLDARLEKRGREVSGGEKMGKWMERTGERAKRPLSLPPPLSALPFIFQILVRVDETSFPLPPPPPLSPPPFLPSRASASLHFDPAYKGHAYLSLPTRSYSPLSPRFPRSPFISLVLPSFPRSPLIPPAPPHPPALPSYSLLFAQLPLSPLILPSLTSPPQPPLHITAASLVLFLHPHPHFPCLTPPLFPAFRLTPHPLPPPIPQLSPH
ncbi:unnamed protein product [Closterium sp. Naga37s-1]|nr:unnamed protein product [Closterium sp. Naga37s-1]